MEMEFIDNSLIKIRNLINEKGYVQIRDLDFMERLYLVWLIETGHIKINSIDNESCSLLNLDEYAFIELNKLSLLRLFIIDNKEEYQRFVTLVKIHGYTDCELNNYLMSQDYSKDINIIFNLSNFACFVMDMEKDENTPKKKLYL